MGEENYKAHYRQKSIDWIFVLWNYTLATEIPYNKSSTMGTQEAIYGVLNE